MKKLKEQVEKDNPERAAIMKAKMPALIKKIADNIDKYDFFTGESMDAEGLVVLLDYREDQVTPFLIVFKDAVVEEKFVSYAMAFTVAVTSMPVKSIFVFSVRRWVVMTRDCLCYFISY